MIKVLSVNQETRKLLEEMLGRTLFDINHSSVLFYLFYFTLLFFVFAFSGKGNKSKNKYLLNEGKSIYYTYKI